MAHAALDQPRSEKPLSVSLRSVGLSDEQFYRLVSDNPELRLEVTADKELIVMAPAGGATGMRNSGINYQLVHWSKHHGLRRVRLEHRLRLAQRGQTLPRRRLGL